MTLDASPPIYSCPPELLEAVLFVLDGHNVARASTVCRHWRDVVKGSTALQYRLHLALNGFAEAPAYLLPPLTERIAALQRYSLFWNYLLVGCEGIRVLATTEIFDPAVHVSSEDCAVPHGRWLVHYDQVQNLTLIAPMPPLYGGERVWKELPAFHDGQPVDVCTLTLKSLDMLIVLTVKPHDNGRLIPRIQLLHAGTLAVHAELPFPHGTDVGEVPVEWTTMSLCGEMLSITFISGQDTVTHTWSWTRGALILSASFPEPLLRADFVPSVELIAENAFCWAEYGRDDNGDIVVVLVVKTFDLATGGPLRAHGRWEFPPLGDGYVAELEMSVWSSDSEEIDSAIRPHAPYLFMHTSPSSATAGPHMPVSDALMALLVAPQGAAPYTFYMLRSTFLHCVPLKRSVPWEEWGPANVRCIPGEVESIHGCRALHRDSDMALKMLTFVPARCRAAQNGVFTDSRDAPNFVNALSCTESPPFLGEFVTGLPYFSSSSAPSEDRWTTSIPSDRSFWCEAGRVAWAGDGDGTIHLATL